MGERGVREDLSEVVSEVFESPLGFSRPVSSRVQTESAKSEASTTSVSEQRANAKQKRKHENENHQLRQLLVPKVFYFIRRFIYWVLGITAVSHFLCLSDDVVIALLTTTTTTVIGILLVAFNWLFDTGYVEQEHLEREHCKASWWHKSKGYIWTGFCVVVGALVSALIGYLFR